MKCQEQLNSFGSPPQSRHTITKKGIKKSDMERTLYEEWLHRVRLFSLGKWSQKGDAMELDNEWMIKKPQPKLT